MSRTAASDLEYLTLQHCPAEDYGLGSLNTKVRDMSPPVASNFHAKPITAFFCSSPILYRKVGCLLLVTVSVSWQGATGEKPVIPEFAEPLLV